MTPGAVTPGAVTLGAVTLGAVTLGGDDQRPDARWPDDRRLAERLAAARLIGLDQLEAAAAAAAAARRPLLDTIAGLGFAQPTDMQRLLARELGIVQVDLLAEPPDPALLDHADPALCRTARMVPWRRLGGRVVVACAAPGPATLLALRAAWGDETEPAIADPAALSWILQRLAPATDPQPRPAVGPLLQLYTGVSLTLAALAWMPGPATVTVAVLALLAGLAARAPRGRIAWSGLAAPSPAPELALAAGRLDPDRLPVCSILVPLLDGAAGLPDLVACLDRLDYPADRQDRRLLIATDDLATLRAVERLGLSAGFELVRLPPGAGHRRDAAVRHGLAGAQGRQAVVWTIGDRPDPGQLRLAAACFAAHPETVAALLPRRWPATRPPGRPRWGPLLWNHLLAPGMARLGLPLPLPTTGVHLRLAALRALPAPEAGAGLGLQLAAAGWSVRPLDGDTVVPPTRRRRLDRLGAWLLRPRAAGRGLGPRARWCFLLVTLGAGIADLAQPVIWLILLAGMAGGAGVLPYLGVAELVIGYAGVAFFAQTVLARRRQLAIEPATPGARHPRGLAALAGSLARRLRPAAVR